MNPLEYRPRQLDQLGDRFVQGVVLHSGPGTYRLDERVTALPICAIWGG